MDRNFIINNWNNLYKSYAKLNPDLALHGINTKRLLLNHYITCGFNENRKIIYEKTVSDEQVSNKNTILLDEQTKIPNKNTILLDESMIIEKIIY